MNWVYKIVVDTMIIDNEYKWNLIEQWVDKQTFIVGSGSACSIRDAFTNATICYESNYQNHPSCPTMYTVTALREITGCGMMDCKKALMQSEYSFRKAIDYLKNRPYEYELIYHNPID